MGLDLRQYIACVRNLEIQKETLAKTITTVDRKINSLSHEGAYNIYENELRMGIIIEKLDVVIQKLDEIQSNQYALYTALQQISNQQSRIISSLQQISLNQDMQNEHLEHIRYNAAALKQNSDIAMIYALY